MRLRMESLQFDANDEFRIMSYECREEFVNSGNQNS